MIPSFYTLEQCDPVVLEDMTMPYVKSYYSCLNRVMGDGYTDDFELSPGGIRVKGLKKEYAKGEFSVVNMFRFEGSRNPGDNLWMYMLETIDGRKGTLVSSKLEEGKQSFLASSLL